MKKVVFNHEKLEGYQISIQFIEWLNPVWKLINNNHELMDQINRASISIALNIAEGNAKSYPKERKRFFEISRASALECAACLDIATVKTLITDEKANEGKDFLLSIVNIVSKLIQSSVNQISEPQEDYYSNSKDDTV